MKVLVAYYSRGGVTKRMAQIIAKAVEKEGLEVFLTDVDKVKPKQLLGFDGIIIGSPTYYGTLSFQVKKLFDESVAFHGQLDGKIGGAFSSARNIAGGNETTVLSILEAMLIHGMIIQGDPRGDHYGPVAMSADDKRSDENCVRFAKRFADLVKRCSS